MAQNYNQFTLVQFTKDVIELSITKLKRTPIRIIIRKQRRIETCDAHAQVSSSRKTPVPEQSILRDDLAIAWTKLSGKV
jgi:hypothetical protein